MRALVDSGMNARPGLLYFQSPVGNRSYAGIGSKVCDTGGLSAVDGRETAWFGSGTMALAAAVGMACRRRDVEGPRVAVPAYSCPDLVSAVRFAGAEPVYVDLARDATTMDGDTLEHACGDERVVAIIGVDLFGIAENWSNLSAVARASDTFLIQDCAQSVQARDAYPADLVGDAAIFSFGRGKPVCCLTGGALLASREHAALLDQLSGRYSAAARGCSPLRLRARNTVYNLLVQPRIYAPLARLLGARLGATRYVPLDRVEQPGEQTIRLLDGSVACYWQRHEDRCQAVFDALEPVLADCDPGVLRWPDRVGAGTAGRRLSRLPLLAGSRQLRDRLLTGLVRSGISATTMYGRSLPEIVAEYDGEPSFQPCPRAEDFAARLLTLPVHARLRCRDIRAVAGSVAETLGTTAREHRQ